ncbi:hypothetical protein FGO68_gene4683 [Halteria grandinella]|uniref:Uncharacterized protein n=1 Tax=Halteria grandinella TaxID=5974 RepID=A0A8J8NHL1_HALGN|nr:hypothetical protein FGO68_gene4683 [Halteria grandinella]
MSKNRGGPNRKLFPPQYEGVCVNECSEMFKSWYDNFEIHSVLGNGVENKIYAINMQAGTKFDENLKNLNGTDLRQKTIEAIKDKLQIDKRERHFQ